MYVPFGLYESHMITDPLTLELGETRESALLLGVDAGGIYGSVYFYNGDTNEASSVAKGDDTVDQMGFSVGMMLEASDVEMDLGFDYMSNIADSDLIEGVVAPTVQDYVSAFGLHGSATFGPFMVLAEIVNASDFNTADLAFNSVGAEPFAMALEGAFYTNLLGYDSSIAVGYQYTDEAVGLGLPETRFLVGLGMEIMEQTNLSFEYRYDEDYETGDGGSGNDGNTFTTQLAVLF
jgi:hypothetical protein